MEFTSRFGPVVGRVLIAVLFLGSGLGKLADSAASLAEINKAGLPFPLLALYGAAFVEVGASLALLAGFRVKFAAAVLVPYTLLAAVLFHSNFGDINQMVHFM